jgi:hypothetical protein
MGRPKKKVVVIEETTPISEIRKMLALPGLTNDERIKLLGLWIKSRAVDARIPIEDAGSGFDIGGDDE